MESKNENKTDFNGIDAQQITYEHNFFNIPWDDRSKKSKICIVGLLCAIFAATMAIVVHNFVVFYKGFQSHSLYSTSEINCNLVRVDKYNYAARLHSVASLELICVGAMVGPSAVLASAVCLNSGPIRVYLGSLTNHQCKKGYSVKVTEFIPHDGVVTKNLVLLTTGQSMTDCGVIIKLNIESKKPSAFIIGRPFHGGRSLSLQPATLIRLDNLTYNMGASIANLNKNNLICAKHHSRCPVRAGDLLVQKDSLIGIASTSTHRDEYNEIACFGNLSLIRHEFNEHDVEVGLM